MRRLNYPLTLAFGLILLATAGWTYKELLSSVFGSFDDSGAPVVRAFDRGGRIALLVSGYTDAANLARGERGVDPSWLRATRETWRDFLEGAGARVHEVTDADVELGLLSSYDLLVLPSTTALSDRQIEQIKRFMQEGRSVMASWTPGIYRPDGSWRGWSFVEETFGVEARGFIERGHASFRVYTDTFPGLAAPGLYRPVVGEGGSPTGSFPALSGYVRTGGLDAARPAASFALADTLTVYRAAGGELRREPATRVQFFTWLGGDPSVAAEAGRDEAAFGRVTIRAGTPLAAGLPAPFRMRTGTFDTPFQMRVAEPRTRAAAFWHDFAATDRLDPAAVRESAAIVYGSYGRGRFVLIGHELSAMGFDPVDQSVLARLFENALRWLGRAPVGWVEAWPQGFERAAMVAALATRSDALLAPLRASGVPFTLFVDADRAGRVADRLHAHREGVELALLGNGIPEDGLFGKRERLGRVTGSPPGGLHLPPAAARRAVARAADAGFDYVFADTLGRLMRPEVLRHAPLVSITRTARSDRHILMATPAGSAELRYAFVAEDLGRAEIEGGLYTLLLHDDGFGQPEHAALLRDILETIQERGFWIAAGRDIARWTRAREGLGVHIEHRGPNRVHLHITNRGAIAAERVALTVDLGRAAERVTVRPELVGTPRPTLERVDDSTVRLGIDHLAPGAYRIYQIDMAPTPARDPGRRARDLRAALRR